MIYKASDMSGKGKQGGIFVGALVALLVGVGAGIGVGYGIWGSSEKVSAASFGSIVEMRTAANEALDDWEVAWSIPVLSEVGTDESFAEAMAKVDSVLGLVSDSIVFQDVPYSLSDAILYDGRPIKTVQDSTGRFVGSENLGPFLYFTFLNSPNFQMQIFARSIAIDETGNNGIPTVTATTSWYLSNPGYEFAGSQVEPINVTVTSRIEFDPSSFLVSSVFDTWDNMQNCPPANSVTGVCA